MMNNAALHGRQIKTSETGWSLVMKWWGQYDPACLHQLVSLSSIVPCRPAKESDRAHAVTGAPQQEQACPLEKSGLQPWPIQRRMRPIQHTSSALGLQAWLLQRCLREIQHAGCMGPAAPKLQADVLAANPSLDVICKQG